MQQSNNQMENGVELPVHLLVKSQKEAKKVHAAVHPLPNLGDFKQIVWFKVTDLHKQ